MKYSNAALLLNISPAAETEIRCALGERMAYARDRVGIWMRSNHQLNLFNAAFYLSMLEEACAAEFAMRNAEVGGAA